MAEDNWLSTDEAIKEVCDHVIELSAGAMEVDIRCPDAEIEAKVKAYLKNKRGTKFIGTYVGGLHDSVKAIPREGDGTPAKTRRKKGDRPPEPEVQIDDEDIIRGGDSATEIMIKSARHAAKMEQIADDKHEAQMADLTPEAERVDMSGLLGDDPDIGGLI